MQAARANKVKQQAGNSPIHWCVALGCPLHQSTVPSTRVAHPHGRLRQQRNLAAVASTGRKTATVRLSPRRVASAVVRGGSSAVGTVL